MGIFLSTSSLFLLSLLAQRHVDAAGAGDLQSLEVDIMYQTFEEFQPPDECAEYIYNEAEPVALAHDMAEKGAELIDKNEEMQLAIGIAGLKMLADDGKSLPSVVYFQETRLKWKEEARLDTFARRMLNYAMSKSASLAKLVWKEGILSLTGRTLVKLIIYFFRALIMSLALSLKLCIGVVAIAFYMSPAGLLVLLHGFGQWLLDKAWNFTRSFVIDFKQFYSRMWGWYKKEQVELIEGERDLEELAKLDLPMATYEFMTELISKDPILKEQTTNILLHPTPEPQQDDHGLSELLTDRPVVEARMAPRGSYDSSYFLEGGTESLEAPIILQLADSPQ